MKRKKNYSKPVRVSNFWSKNYIEHERNSDRNKAPSVGEYLSKIRPYLKGIINNRKKSDTWEIQLTIANIFISSIVNDEECVMHSKRDNIEIMINDEADEARTEKQQKYQHYHLKKLINMNILQVKKYYLLIKDK